MTVSILEKRMTQSKETEQDWRITNYNGSTGNCKEMLKKKKNLAENNTGNQRKRFNQNTL